MYQLLFMRMYISILYSDTYLLMHLMNITKIKSAVHKIAIGEYCTVHLIISFSTIDLLSIYQPTTVCTYLLTS